MSETNFSGMNEMELANIEYTCRKCGEITKKCWCFAADDALEHCRCNIPNLGLPLTGEGLCQVCGKNV